MSVRVLEATVVHLAAEEYALAAYVGFRRGVSAQLRGSEQRWTEPGDTWSNDVRGAIGEYAVAKLLNVFWDGALVKGRGDVQGLEVRSTRSRSLGLPVYPWDEAGKWGVLVELGGFQGTPRQFRCVVLGAWVLATGPEDPSWVKTHTASGAVLPAGTYYVPRERLLPVEIAWAEMKNAGR